MRSKYLATALAIAAPFAAGGCAEMGGNSPEQTWYVGNADWVRVKEDITQHYRNDDETLKAGQTCFLERGAELVLKGGNVYYSDKNAGGTECPDGAEVNVSVRQATAQNRKFIAFAERRRDIANQIKDMRVAVGPSVIPKRGGVDVVNSTPIKQRYSGAGGTPDSELLHYGDNCFADGRAVPIGHLATGQAVMRISNPDQVGTSCPSGTLYLMPPGPS